MRIAGKGFVGLLLLASSCLPAIAGEIIPVYPRYPYYAGHYPTADSYFDLPPYAAIPPSYYQRRNFLLAQERNRYRYIPHVFSGHGELSK
jgi:hypothetical protein